MAGLLAWAADVVGGSASPEHEENAGSSKPILRLTPEQRMQMSALDARAAALQHSLWELRQCIPPASIAQRLPHLHADSLATHAALALERHAHATTRVELEQRQASLQSENATYRKALSATRQHVAEKNQDERQLEAERRELEETEGKLLEELEKLQSGHDGDVKQLEGDHGNSVYTGPVDDVLPDSINKLRRELDLLDSKAVLLGKELATLQQSSAKWPSPAQREKDLERRLRILTEQLVTKQAQAETWASERNALELRLENANEALRQLLAGNVDVNSKRNKIGKSGLASSSAGASVGFDDYRSDPVMPGAPVRHRAAKGVASVARTVDALGLQAGNQLRRHPFLRSLTIIYIIGLHVAVFIILSFAGFAKPH